MLGMYSSVLGAVDDRAFGDVAMVAAGAVVGLALFSTILGRLLEHHRDTVLAVLVGLMAGSLRVLWPWPNGVGVVSRHAGKLVSGTSMAWPTAGDLWPPLVLAAVAFLMVLGLDAWSRRT
jgi:putative membrane protein